MTAPAGNERDVLTSQNGAEDEWLLIRRIGTGDQSALEQLYRRYYGGLYRFVLQITRRTDTIEEVINEVMFVVWQKAATVEQRSRVSTWILGIAHYKALQSLRRSTPSAGMPFDENAGLVPEVEGSSALQKLETEELLFALMRTLSPEQRAVMELVYHHGLHYSEIAQVIDCPENTVKTRVFHARRKLRSLWPELTGSRLPGRDEPDLR